MYGIRKCGGQFFTLHNYSLHWYQENAPGGSPLIPHKDFLTYGLHLTQFPKFPLGGATTVLKSRDGSLVNRCPVSVQTRISAICRIIKEFWQIEKKNLSLHQKMEFKLLWMELCEYWKQIKEFHRSLSTRPFLGW